MRLSAVTVFLLLLAGAVIISAAGSTVIYVVHLRAQQEMLRDVLLADEADLIANLGHRYFAALEGALARGGRDGLLDAFAGEDCTPYAAVAWDESGKVVDDTGAPRWMWELAAGEMGEWLDRSVLAGTNRFRVDSFDDYRAGKVDHPMCVEVAHFPDADVFIGFGGPLTGLSARVKGIQARTWESWRWWAFGGGTALFGVLLVLCAGAYFYFRRAVRDPLEALLGGAARPDSRYIRGGVSREAGNLQAVIGELKEQSRAADAAAARRGEELASAREMLAKVRADFDYLLRQARQELESRYDARLEAERRALYARLEQALRAVSTQDVEGEDPLRRRLELVLGNGVLAAPVPETIDLADWLPGIARGGNPPVTLNIQSRARVRVDAARLREALEELLQNARLNAGPGGNVYLNCVESDGEVHISVGNEGASVQIPDKSMVFFPFYSAQSGGLGLGLTWAAALLDSIGCALALYAEEGKGCAAVVRIPGALLEAGGARRID